MFEHVVFDLDGTLVDSREDLAAAVNHVLRSVGLRALPVETLAGYVGDGARMLVQRALGRDRQELLPSALEAFLDYYGDHLLDATRAPLALIWHARRPNTPLPRPRHPPGRATATTYARRSSIADR